MYLRNNTLRNKIACTLQCDLFWDTKLVGTP